METPANNRWQRLMVLLEPLHEQALATARRLCRSPAEGDDLYHDALLQAFDRLPTLRDETRFRSWFYAVLLNRHRSRCRRSFWSRFLPLEEAFPPGVEPAGERGETWSERSLQAGRFARALARMRPEQREAVVLFEVDGFSIEEIAAMQRASVSAVKSRLVRGREALRRHYEHEESGISVPAADASVALAALETEREGERR